jgi:enoyl-CoA hydratase/carnithine racemase
MVELKRPETRAVLLRGEGPAFSYGADLKEFVTRPPSELFPLMQEYLDILGEFEASEKPTLAAVHGVCSSGGLELALAFDQIWAAVGTKIGFLELNIATPPLAAGVQRIAARAGRARAFEVTTSGHWYEAEQFERWNIINRVLPVDTLQAEAEALRRNGPPGLLGLTVGLRLYFALGTVMELQAPTKLPSPLLRRSWQVTMRRLPLRLTARGARAALR